MPDDNDVKADSKANVKVYDLDELKNDYSRSFAQYYRFEGERFPLCEPPPRKDIEKTKTMVRRNSEEQKFLDVWNKQQSSKSPILSNGGNSKWGSAWACCRTPPEPPMTPQDNPKKPKLPDGMLDSTGNLESADILRDVENTEEQNEKTAGEKKGEGPKLNRLGSLASSMIDSVKKDFVTKLHAGQNGNTKKDTTKAKKDEEEALLPKKEEDNGEGGAMRSGNSITIGDEVKTREEDDNGRARTRTNRTSSINGNEADKILHDWSNDLCPNERNEKEMELDFLRSLTVRSKSELALEAEENPNPKPSGAWPRAPALGVGIMFEKLYAVNTIEGSYRCRFMLRLFIHGKPEWGLVEARKHMPIVDKFSFANCAELEQRHHFITYQKIVGGIKTAENDIHVWGYFTQIDGKFYEPMDLNAFPYDVQMLNIKLRNVLGGNAALRPVNGGQPVSDKYGQYYQLFPLAEETEFRGFKNIQGYHVPKKIIMQMVWVDEKRHHVSISLVAKREYRFYETAIMLPLAVLTFISFLTFAIPYLWLGMPSSLDLPVTMMLTAVSFRFTIADKLPNLSYTTIMDKMINVNFYLLAVVFLENLLAGTVLPRVIGDDCDVEEVNIGLKDFDGNRYDSRTMVPCSDRIENLRGYVRLAVDGAIILCWVLWMGYFVYQKRKYNKRIKKVIALAEKKHVLVPKGIINEREEDELKKRKVCCSYLRVFTNLYYLWEADMNLAEAYAVEADAVEAENEPEATPEAAVAGAATATTATTTAAPTAQEPR